MQDDPGREPENDNAGMTKSPSRLPRFTGVAGRSVSHHWGDRPRPDVGRATCSRYRYSTAVWPYHCRCPLSLPSAAEIDRTSCWERAKRQSFQGASAGMTGNRVL